MNDFAIMERNRAFARAIEHLKAAVGHVRFAENENTQWSLGLAELAELDKKLMHAIHCCAHVYKQPPETPA